MIISFTRCRYIVYDVAQIQAKYLLKTEFKFKWWSDGDDVDAICDRDWSVLMTSNVRSKDIV